MNKKEREFIKHKIEDFGYCNVISLNKITKPITILLGPNGTGKSTSIRQMINDLKEQKIKNIRYTTSRDDIVQKGSNPFDFRPEYLVSAFHSEGERMDDSFYTWMNTKLVKALLEDKEPIYIFIDEMDSGLSIDKIYRQSNDLMFLLKSELSKGRDIHIILSANSYEMAEYFLKYKELVDYIWLPSKEKTSLGSYNTYKKKYLDYYKEMKLCSNGDSEES